MEKNPNQPTEGKITGDVHKSRGRRHLHGFYGRGGHLVLDSSDFDSNWYLAGCQWQSKKPREDAVCYWIHTCSDFFLDSTVF
jgi:hypothetical protein